MKKNKIEFSDDVCYSKTLKMKLYLIYAKIPESEFNV